MWHHLDIWLLLAGLGIFLFGIRLMEDAIAKLAGRAFRTLIRTSTKGRLRSILTGTLTTAILQSSSAVTLMALAFVGAGLIPFLSGVGLVLGSNIGTTATSWIVATIGFKMDIERLALPFIGTGGLLLIFLGTKPRATSISHLLVGFGFLFLGLDQMKASVSGFADGIDPALMKGAPAWAFLLAGLVLTAAMQSSSATVAILLTALHGGLFGLNDAAYAIIGSNIGTTVTVLLGALGGNILKKRLAFTHVLFNVFAAVLAVAAMPLYMKLILAVEGQQGDPFMGVALFHTLFNVIGVVVFIPLMGLFSRWLERVVKEHREPVTRYIHQTGTEVVEAAVQAVQSEVRHLLVRVIAFHLYLLGIDEELVLTGHPDAPRESAETWEDRYLRLKRLQSGVLTFATQVEQQELTAEWSDRLNHATHAARLSLYAAKGLKDVRADLEEFEASPDPFIHGLFTRTRRRMVESHMALAHLLGGEPPPDGALTITRLLRRLQQEDSRCMAEVTQAIREGALRDAEVGTVLLVNRALAQTGRELALAAAELLLPASELTTLERVLEVQEEVPGSEAP
ncbi:MAG: Na/Pi cotransporter family protein [Flavobacteriales bacterium]|nr:Na/Pi cotransporter family protein [Flavobacteriales bacterium]